MPTSGGARGFVKKTWKTMAAWERKAFHRVNEGRARANLPSLNKP